MPALYH